MSRLRWLVWSLYAVLWTTALVFPIIPATGVWSVDEIVEPNRYLIAKTVHVSAFAFWTALTGWLRAPLRYRWLLIFVLMAHATATEMVQWITNEMHVSTRTGHLHDVAYDNVGVLIGLLLTWKWWMEEG